MWVDFLHLDASSFRFGLLVSDKLQLMSGCHRVRVTASLLESHDLHFPQRRRAVGIRPSEVPPCSDPPQPPSSVCMSMLLREIHESLWRVIFGSEETAESAGWREELQMKAAFTKISTSSGWWTKVTWPWTWKLGNYVSVCWCAAIFLRTH